MNRYHLAALLFFITEVCIYVSAVEPYPAILEKVAVRDKALFERIDSIIYNTDITMTVKPKYRERIKSKRYDILDINRVSIDSWDPPCNNTEYWLCIGGICQDEDDVVGNYYFNTSHYNFTAFDFDDILFKTKLGIKQQFDMIYMRFYSHGSPLWFFKIVDDRIAEAYYTYDELDAFTGVVYDILNKRIVSEGFGESGY